MKKNNDEILYNSISNIDENIIASSLVYKPKSKKIIIWASLAACLCAVSVTYAVIYKNNFNKSVNNSEVLSTTNSSSDFHIYSLPKVLSENSENSKQKVLLSPVMTLLDSNTGIHAITYTVDFKSDGSPYDDRDTSYSGNIIKQDLFDISPDSIEFSIASDAVEYYNVTVKNNCISYQSDSACERGVPQVVHPAGKRHQLLRRFGLHAGDKGGKQHGYHQGRRTDALPRRRAGADGRGRDDQ